MLSRNTSKQRVKDGKTRKLSSRMWLERQLSDPYVNEARKLGYRSRAAFKLIEINDEYKILKPSYKVLDLGCAPGGFSQVAVNIVGAGNVIGIDLLSVEPITGCVFLELDFLQDASKEKLKEIAGGKVDVILSDMAPATTGHKGTDHLRIMVLCEQVFDFAEDMLKEGGTLLIKTFQGGTEKELLLQINAKFTKIIHVKPKSSRKDSAELYLLAIGFKGV